MGGGVAASVPRHDAGGRASPASTTRAHWPHRRDGGSEYSEQPRSCLLACGLHGIRGRGREGSLGARRLGSANRKTAAAFMFWSAGPCRSEFPRGVSWISRARSPISGCSNATSEGCSLSVGCVRATTCSRPWCRLRRRATAWQSRWTYLGRIDHQIKAGQTAFVRWAARRATPTWIAFHA